MASAKKAASATKATTKAAKAGASKPAKAPAAAKSAAHKAGASSKSVAKKGAAAKPAAATKGPAAKKASGKPAVATSKPSVAKSSPAKAVAAKQTSSKSADTKVPAAKRGTTAPAPSKTASSTKASTTKASTTKASTTKASTTKASTTATATKTADPAKKAGQGGFTLPSPKGVTKDGITYTKDFDVKFLTSQKALLLDERAALVGQATLLEDEANSIIAEQEMGDVQFDDEGGEGDTMVVERERDLALSAQARQTVADIDAALERLAVGTYGYSTQSGRPIPRERLEAIPWAVVLVEEKVGGIGRR